MIKRLNRGFYILKKMPNTLFILIVALSAFFISSCSTSKCTLCDIDNRTVYNIEMKEGVGNQKKENILSYFPPVPIEAAGKKVRVYLVDCNGKEPYRLSKGKDLQQFVKENLIVVDSLDIKRITRSSDADIYPEINNVKKLMDENKLKLCRRFRTGFKTEIRFMTGFRSFNPTTYEPIPGDIPLEKKTLGFGQEGTKITIGPEVAFLPAILTVKNKHRLNLGLLSGYWPVDGGNYIPIAIHPRFTFNDITNPLEGNCNAYYLFGDLGTAYDVSGKFDKFWSNKLNSWFFDLGAGVDLWVTRKMDVSFDIGYRLTTLALPSLTENSDWADCIENHNVAWTDYPRRRAGDFFIRIGVTF
jgi:hypothetical protein